MKQLFSSVIALLITTIAVAQVPQLMNYQAVARNTAGQALANQTIKVRLSANENGSTTFYIETRNVTTNALGLFNVQIGATGALSTSGSLSATNWLDATKTRNLKVELDPNNSGTFIDMGSQQLVSVPYALAAKEAETAQTLSTTVPAFYVLSTSSTTVNNVTLGTGFYLKHNSKSYDSHNDYNVTTGEYIVPQDGTYYFTAAVRAVNSTAAQTSSIKIEIDVDGTVNGGATQSTQLNNEASVNVSYVNNLKAGDKVRVYFGCRGNGGTLTLNDLYYVSGTCYFQGYRIR